MTRIEAVAYPKQIMSDDVYTCGLKNFDERDISVRVSGRVDEGWVVRISNDGYVSWMLKIAGSAPIADVIPSD